MSRHFAYADLGLTPSQMQLPSDFRHTTLDPHQKAKVYAFWVGLVPPAELCLLFAGVLPTAPASAINSRLLLASRCATYVPLKLDGEHGGSMESVAACFGSWMAMSVGSCFMGIGNAAVWSSAAEGPRWAEPLAMEVAFGVHGGATACVVCTAADAAESAELEPCPV